MLDYSDFCCEIHLRMANLTIGLYIGFQLGAYAIARRKYTFLARRNAAVFPRRMAHRRIFDGCAIVF